MIMASFGFLYAVSPFIDKKPQKMTFTEKEFKEHEERNGLRRRSKLISHEQNDQYTFYVVPFVHSKEDAEQVISQALSTGKQTKLIDSAQLVEKEIENEGKYSFLLKELKETGRTLPRGLLTALMKQEIGLFINTTSGQYDTNLVLLNYPQSTEEAIKFENDISDIEACVVLKKQSEEDLTKDLSGEEVRRVNNVIGYFDTVNKVQTWE